MRDNHRKVTEEKKVRILSFIKDSKYHDMFEMYNGIKLMTNDKRALQLFIPPKGIYDQKLIEDWLDFMHERILNVESCNELLDSHSFRFRNPESFIEKFFINYGKGGNNGKSFLTECLRMIYPNMANVAVRQEDIENDKFNSWTARNLMIWLEEAENGKTNYKNHTIEQRVKQLTTKNTNLRGMYAESLAARNWAIVGMNTNQTDLYGLVRGPHPLIPRLVINPPMSKPGLNWNLVKKAWSDRIAMDKKAKSFTENPNFAYSLYHYLAFERIIRNDFSTVRYDGKDKYDFIEKARMGNKNTVEEWFTECHDVLFKERKSRNKIYMNVSVTNANDSYKDYKDRSRNQYAPMKINETMERLGFTMMNTTVKHKGVRLWLIEKKKYDELINRLNDDDDLDVIEFDDDDENFDDETI